MSFIFSIFLSSFANILGFGCKRALIVTLLQHLAMTIPAESSEKDGQGSASQSEKSTETAKGPDLILASKRTIGIALKLKEIT